MKDLSNKEELAYLSAIIESYENGIRGAQSITKEKLHLSIESSLFDVDTILNVLFDFLDAHIGVNASSKREAITDQQLGDLKDYIKKCFDCDGRVGFEFQLTPDLGLLTVFADFLEEIENLLQMLENMFAQSSKRIEQLCMLLQLFNGTPCPQDIVLLLMSLKMYLSKLLMAAFSFKLDWFSLIGPILQGIASIIGQLLNSIIDIIYNPISCMKTQLNTNLYNLNLLMPELITTDKKENKITEGIEKVLNSELFDLEIKPDAYVSSNTVLDEIKPALTFDVNMNLNIFMPIEEMLVRNADENSFLDFNIAEQLVLIVNETERYLKNLKNEINNQLSVFIKLGSSNKLLEIKRLVLAGVVFDLITLLIGLAKFNNFENICNNKTNTVLLSQMIETITGTPNNVIINDNQITVNYISDVPKSVIINSCAVANNTAEQTIRILNNILEGKS